MPALDILIADDHSQVRQGLRQLIESRPEWRVCGEAADGNDALQKARALQPDVVLMDVSMPGMDGLEATRLIRREMPNSAVIIISQNDTAVLSGQSKEAGAWGFVSKSNLAERLLTAIEQASRNRGQTPSAVPPNNGNASTRPVPRSEMQERVANFDWSKTPVGTVKEWPVSLKTAVQIILNSRYPMFVWWGKEYTNFYNDAYIPMLGKKHPHALGRPASEVWAEIWPVVGPQADSVLIKGESTWNEELLLVMERNGFTEESYFTFSYSPAPNDDGGIGGVFCAVTEDTQRVLAQRRVRVLHALAEQANLARSGEEACKVAAEILSQHPKDLPFTLLYLLNPEQQQATLAGITGVPVGSVLAPEKIDVREPGVWPFERVIASNDSVLVPELPSGTNIGRGELSPKRVVVLPMAKPGQSTLAGFVVAGISPMLELTQEYKAFLNLLAAQIATAVGNARAYAEERRRAEALAEIDRAKTAFFSNVSHEFRTPLTLMLGPLEDSLDAPNGLPAETRTRIQVAHRNSIRLLRLVNTLLDFSRLEAGRMEASYEETNLSELTEELASMFRSATERAGLKLAVKCEQTETRAYVDREMWEKIVFNLLSNAFKFTLQGEIEVSLRYRNDQAELSVRDTGVGVPAADLPHLFERFYRAKGTEGRTIEGSGIGLSLVWELVRCHGGTVRADSTLGEGSTFTVSIPLGKSHLPSDRIGAHRTLASTSLRSEAYVQEALRWLPDAEAETADLLSGLDSLPPTRKEGERSSRILVADDNPDMREYVGRLLGEHYEVETVGDGESALIKARQQRPDLILSDVMMPRLDGFGLLRAVRQDEALRGVPVILLSARAGEESRIEGLQSGADDYLIKPFSAREMLARVRAHLEMARIRKQSAAVERQLRLDAELLAAIVESSDNAIMSKDLNGIINSWNRSAERMFGYTGEEAVGQHIRLIVPPERWEEEADILTRLRGGEGIDHLETVRKRKDGTILDVSVTISPVRDASGKVIGASTVARDITEEKRAARALRKSEERLRALVKAGSYVMYRMNPDWSEMRQLEGGGFIENTEHPTTGWLENYIDPEDQQQVQSAIQKAINTKSVFELEHRVRRVDGTLGWTLSRAVPVLDERGQIVEWFGAASDITARKEAERRLLEQQTRVEFVASAAQVGFWFCDLPFDKLQWDQRVKEQFWLPPDAEVTMQVFYDRLHPDDRERTRQAIEQAIANRTYYEIDYRTVSPAGKEKWIRAVGRSFYDASGQPRRFDGLTIDITERREAQERERKMTAEAVAATAKFRAVFEQTGVFAAVADKQGMVVDANRLWVESSGQKDESLIGRPIWETAWWRKLPAAQDKIRQAVALAAEGTPYREILHYLTDDGTERLLDFALYPITDEKGEVLFLHPTGVDITDVKRAEENYRQLSETLDLQVRERTAELRQRNSEILRQSEQLRQLSWQLMRTQDDERRHIARELHDSAGQTLTVLGIALAQLVHKSGRLAPDLAKDAELIQESVQQLHRDIRTTSYLLHPPLLDETGLSSALRWYVEGLGERSDVDIVLDISDEFGRLPADMELVIFRLVQECLTNIHRHSGSKTATIRVLREPESIVVNVQDQGRGMSPERLAEVQSRGSGVGIRGLKERLRQFDGRLDIESGEGGTRVIATIPLHKAVSPQHQNGNEPMQAAV